MSLIKAHAKINNIKNRVVPYGKKDVLEFIDRNTHEVLGTAKLWSWQRLNPLQQDGPVMEFRIAATPDIEEILSTCLLAFNGVLHDVPVRNAPDSINGIE